MAERHARILAELSELGLGLARQARADADAAETPEERARAALVFQRVSRSIRQSLALEAKLARDVRREEREDADAQKRRDREQVRFRKHRLRTGVEALVWRETENLSDEDEEAFGDALDALVDDESVSEAFLHEPLADQVARVIAGLGYEIAPDGGVRPKPARPCERGDPGFLSSA